MLSLFSEEWGLDGRFWSCCLVPSLQNEILFQELLGKRG